MRSFTAVSRICGLTLLALSPVLANAQTIYVTSDQTINTDVSGNDIFVGKDPAFNTLATPVTLNVNAGAVITSTLNGTLEPDGVNYVGLHVFSGHFVNINGGSVAGAAAHPGGTINMSGGSVTVLSSTAATANVHGGTLQYAEGFTNGVVNIDGGTILASPEIFQTSTLNLAGSNFNVVQGSQYWNYDGFNGTESRIRDYTVTGTLSDGTAFNQTISAAADSATITPTNIQLRGWSTDQVAPDHVSASNESVNSLWSNVYVGRDQVHSFDTSPTVSFDAGTHVGTISAFNNSQVTINAGRIDSTAYLSNNSTATVTGGSVNLLGTLDNSQANVTGGSVTEILNYSGTATVSGGSVTDAFGVGNGTTNIQGGTVNTISGYATSIINISGGVMTELGGTANSVFNITGGTFQIGSTIGTEDHNVVNIYGNNLSYALLGHYGSGPNQFNLYSLGGQLLDGSSINGVEFLDYDGGLEIGNPYQGAANAGNLRFFGTFAPAAPEPGSLLLLGFGLIPCRRLLRRQQYRTI